LNPTDRSRPASTNPRIAVQRKGSGAALSHNDSDDLADTCAGAVGEKRVE